MSTRGMNWHLWVGLALAPIAFLSYPFVFERWPVTRDFPWATLLIFGISGALLAVGLRRACAPGRLQAVRIASALIAAAMFVGIFIVFGRIVFVHARHLPTSAHSPRVGDRAPDFTLPDESNTPISLGALLSSTPAEGTPASKGVLLVFSMYAGCRACNSEYRGIQQHLGDLLAMGVRPVVISTDPPDVSRALSREASYTFTFLSDPSLSVIRRYDVANGHEARPAEFLLDSSGVVRWRHLTSSVLVRARPEQLIGAIRAMQD
jgi:peroxiredoxin